MLSDPLKDSSRTQESWNAFLTKLRTLLLMSFTKNLGKFEDDMRTLREKRTEPGWGFCEYFMVQVLGSSPVSLGRRRERRVEKSMSFQRLAGMSLLPCWVEMTLHGESTAWGWGWGWDLLREGFTRNE